MIGVKSGTVMRKNFEMGYASAMAWVLLAIIGVSTAIAFLSSKYWVHYADA